MKLGDNMATVEACNIWGDMRPRKSRPPRIGDIPRHGAVDEESPGVSSKKLTSSPSDPPEPMLDISLGAQGEDAFTTKTSSARRSATFELQHGLRACAESDAGRASVPTIADRSKFRLSDSTKRQDDETETADRLTLTLDALQDLSKISSLSERRPVIVDKSSDLEGTMQVESLEHEGVNEVSSQSENLETAAIVVVKRPSLTSRISESICNLIGLSSSSQESRQVRKDSAVCLEEAEDLQVPRENLGPRSVRCLTPRRESSGYASNLGTFDEDRKSFEVDLSSLRERRRSSTKRLTLDAYQTRPVNEGGESASVCENILSLDKIPTNEMHRKVSSSGLGMPDIAEAKDTELVQDPLIRVGSSVRCEGLVETCPIVDECGANVPVPLARDDDVFKVDGTLSGSCHEGSKINVVGTESSINDETYSQGLTRTGSTSKARMESFRAQTFSSSSSSEASSENLGQSPGKAHQRKRIIVHQCSTPNFSSTELERIVERPSEKSPDNQKDTATYSDLQERRRSTRREEEEEEKEKRCDELEDVRLEDNKVVADESGEHSRVARLEDNEGIETGEASSKDKPDSMRLLPKPVKVYRLLSTQSEDRDDSVSHLTNRRISLQISRHEDEVLSASGLKPEDKKLLHSDSVPTLNIPGHSDPGPRLLTPTMIGCSPVRKLSSPGEIGTTPRLAGDSGTAGIRPIYPYYPYSPYGSPQGSPGTRRRPLRESRRVSIDNKQGALQLNQYKLLDNIGQGSFGIVKLVYNEEDETHYAMKILSKKKLMKKAGIFGRMAPGRRSVSSNPLAKVYREIALLKKLDHPNVVKLVEVLDDPDEDNLYLVFELVQRGEVLQVPTNKPLDENTAWTNFRDIVMGVEYLHYQRIVHRDIKPSNLLVDSEGRVKVADLGVSAELRVAGELLSGSAGAPAFAAPETTTPGAQYSGTLCDVWSMGVTLYSLVTGRVPWDGAGSIIGVQAAIRSEPLKFPEKPELSENVRDLISRMLSKEPSERITLREIKNHTWVTKNDMAPLPSEADNCQLPVTVTDEEVARVVTRVPKLDTLILIKTMLKQHSFQNPFLPRRNTRSTCSDATTSELSSVETNESSGTPESGDSKTEQFHKTGRSNSAPDSYEWHASERQVSIENPLPPVTEASNQETEVDKR